MMVIRKTWGKEEKRQKGGKVVELMGRFQQNFKVQIFNILDKMAVHLSASKLEMLLKFH